MTVKEFLEQKPYVITLAVAGLFLVVAGLVAVAIIIKQTKTPGIEITKLDETTEGQSSEIFVDVAGEVLKPGIYQLPVGARLNDALVAAGGLTAEADRDWFAKNINLAAKLTDGAKIYIPASAETAAGSQVTRTDLVNINTASAAELDKLWGVGPVTAEKIISSRPYSSIEELLTRKIVKTNVYEAIKEQISVY